MLLMVVGKYRDEDYCVLDLNTTRVTKMTEEGLIKAIQSKCVGNAHLAWYNKKIIKGNYMSFSRLRYVEDVAKKPKYVVLYAYSNGKKGYVVCLQDGSNVHWVSLSDIKYDTRDYVNVSAYLTKREASIISCKGYEFPHMCDLLREGICERELEDEPVRLQVDFKAIQEKRKEELKKKQGRDSVYATEIDDLIKEYVEQRG